MSHPDTIAARPHLVEAIAFSVLLMVGALDRITPPEFSAVMLYLGPLGFVAWYGTPGGQIRTILAAVVIWGLMDTAELDPHAWWIYFWLVAEKVILFNGVTYLIVHLRHALATQRQLSGMLGERLRVVEQLAAGVAHEVRNPLGTLLSGIEYLGRRERPESERMLVEDMHGAVVRAEVIVRDLNDFSAPLRLCLEPIALQSAVRQAAKEAAGKAAAAGVTLEVETETAVTAQADLTRLVQVLVNLLRNAVDASPRGGVVRIAVRPAHGSVAIDIDDDGPGIPPERLAKVFEPFYTTKAPGLGTGLGLAVSRRIAEDHHGELQLFNRPGAGLRASLILPLGETA